MRVAVDTGGTFTDFVAETSEGLKLHKVPSTPANPSKAILKGLRELKGPEPLEELFHGTTVGTNAFLTRQGAKVVLLTTQGFEDVIFIGRQARPELYNFEVEKPPPVIPRSRVLGVRERILAGGQVALPLKKEELERVKLWVSRKKPEAVAISLLHAYANPWHERLLAEALSDLDLPLSLSSEVHPEFREFERTSTTLLNAYLAPVVFRYVQELCQKLPETRIFIMQSNGGLLPALAVQDRAVMTLLSGPAGGVMGALRLAQSLGFERILTLDMGGTSTDVSLAEGKPLYTKEYQIEEHPVALPLIDIHTIGAGGGSVAWFDPGGALRVGPQSAGADPGPACYGQGGLAPTVTDANLLAGRLLPHRFLGGRKLLRLDLARKSVEALASAKSTSLEDLTYSILEIVNTNMEAALRKVSLEKGYDPRAFALVAFGGAGGLHATELAARLEIPRVLVPHYAGVLSALGMLATEPRFDFFLGLSLREKVDYETLQAKLEELKSRALKELSLWGLKEDWRLEAWADTRYRGQAFEIAIPLTPSWAQDFHREHQRLYGWQDPKRSLEVTALRLTATASRPPLPWPEFKGGTALSPAEHSHLLLSPRHRVRAPVYLWDQLPVEAEFKGPALVVGEYSTVYLSPGFRGACDRFGHLHLYL